MMLTVHVGVGQSLQYSDFMGFSSGAISSVFEGATAPSSCGSASDPATDRGGTPPGFDGTAEAVQDCSHVPPRRPFRRLVIAADCLEDALDGLLPLARQEQLSSLLSPTDLATLRHLVTTGMGQNTARALASDLAYLERWCLAATGSPLPWPAERDLLLKFVAHHLWDPIRKETDPGHGMPEEVADALRLQGALVATGRMRPPRFAGGSPSGARCTAGAGSTAPSPTVRSARPCASPSGRRRGRRCARASVRSRATSSKRCCAPAG